VDVGQGFFQGQHIHSGFDVVAMVAERAAFPAKVFVHGQNHAALTSGGKMLGLAEAEAADIADGADGAAVIFAADGLRTVLDNIEVMLLRNVHDAAHITDDTVQMHDDDALGAVGDLALNIIRVNGVVGGHVAENGDRTGLHDGIGGRDEGIRRDEHLVAGANAEAGNANMQGCRAAGAGNCHGRAGPLTEFFFKLHALLAGPVADEAGIQRVGHILLGFRVKLRPHREAELGDARAVHCDFFFIHVHAPHKNQIVSQRSGCNSYNFNIPRANYFVH